MHLRAWLAVLAALLSLGACAPVAPPSASSGRPPAWQNHVARNATVEWVSENRFVLSDLRNFAWDKTGARRERWERRSYDLSRLRGIWFNVEPFPRAPNLAHTFLTFAFAAPDGVEALTLSIEARREIGQDYSPLAGLQGAYELIFAWSTEKDILTDSVLHLGHRVEMYPVNVTAEQARRILRGFLARTAELAARPERYNTLRHNCTTELAAVVNRAFGPRLPWDPAFVLTAQSAAYLHRLGYLGDPKEPFAALRARAAATPLVAAYRDLPERRFSAAIRRNLAAWRQAAGPGAPSGS